MANWNIAVPDTLLSLDIKPLRGDIIVEDNYETAVHYPLRGNDVAVTDIKRGNRTVTVPELVFRSVSEVNQLRVIRNLGRRCLLTDRFGRVFPVKFVGPLRVRTPDAEYVDDLFLVTVSFIGVP